MKALHSKHVVLLLLAASSAVWLTDCGWRDTAVLRSPRHNMLLRVRQPRVFPQVALEVDVESGGTVVYTWRAPGREYFLSFIQDYWSEDGAVCGLYAAGTNTVEFAFDLRTRVAVPFNSIADGVTAQIKQTYGVDQDQLNWANSADGSMAFAKRCQLRRICLTF